MCLGNCDFQWLVSATPLIKNINADNKSAIVLNGQGFDIDSSNNDVEIGSYNCKVISASSSQLTCFPGLFKFILSVFSLISSVATLIFKKGQIPNGIYNITLLVKNKGYAIINSTIATIDFELIVNSFSPNVSAIGGKIN